MEMAGRQIEKFPVVWAGDVILKDIKIHLKATYLWGDISTAIEGLSKEDQVAAILFNRELRLPISEDLFYQNKRSCVLTCVAEESDKEMNARAEVLFRDIGKEMVVNGTTGFAADDHWENYNIHIYVKSKNSSSVLAQLAPDYFHMFCDRLYMLMVVHN